jgi:hypothetical protein
MTLEELYQIVAIAGTIAGIILGFILGKLGD